MQKKIRNAQLEKVPYMLILGDQEVTEKTVNMRHRNGTIIADMPLADLTSRLKREIEHRQDTPIEKN